MKKGLSKGVYILPNLFTTANLFCGFSAIMKSIAVLLGDASQFSRACWLLFLAAIFDMIDGRVARSTNTASKFGVEYDSLADTVSFGVAPSLLLYAWGMKDFGKVGWVAVFMYVACGTLRLARYNVQSQDVEKNFFQGLPIPIAALAVLLTTLLFEPDYQLLRLFEARYFVLSLTYVVALLMISELPYRSVKSLSLTATRPLYYLFFIVLVYMAIAMEPYPTLFVFVSAYVLSGPFEWIYKNLLGRGEKTLPKKKMSLISTPKQNKNQE